MPSGQLESMGGGAGLAGAWLSGAGPNPSCAAAWLWLAGAWLAGARPSRSSLWPAKLAAGAWPRAVMASRALRCLSVSARPAWLDGAWLDGAWLDGAWLATWLAT